MGAQLTSFSSQQVQATTVTHPNKNDWITKHATVTGLAIVEIERLWVRFQQLGCNEDGSLTPEVFTRPPASQDIFIKNILTTFKGSKAAISFQDFANAMKWAENTTLEKKVAGVFYLLNNGSPVKRDIMYKIMRRTYPDDTEENVQRITSVFMEQIDDTNQGMFTEEQFVRWVTSMPRDQIEAILDFQIIPQALNEEAQKQFSSLPSRFNPTIPEPSFSRQVPTDAVLKQVSDKINKRDWHMLANKLNFTTPEIANYERRSSKKKEQCYEMLKGWREREGNNAYAEILENALRESKFNDAALLLYP